MQAFLVLASALLFLSTGSQAQLTVFSDLFPSPVNVTVPYNATQAPVSGNGTINGTEFPIWNDTVNNGNQDADFPRPVNPFSRGNDSVVRKFSPSKKAPNRPQKNDFSPALRGQGKTSQRPVSATRIPLPAGTVVSVSIGTSFLLIVNKPENGTALPGQKNHWIIPISILSTGKDAAEAARVLTGSDGSVTVGALPLSGAIVPVRADTTSVVIQDDGRLLESNSLHGGLPPMQAILPYEVPLEQSVHGFGAENDPRSAANDSEDSDESD